jgi:uncharacterized protein YaiI (UPF0178 family)
MIWVDADAIPAAVKDVIIRAALKRGVPAIFVANKLVALPPSERLTFMLADSSPDAADRLIAEHAGTGELVITQDIPLAAILVGKGITVINPHGTRFSEENIGERLATRDLMDSLRSQGEITGGPSAFGDREKRAFSATFDRELTRLLKTRARN